MAAAGVGVGIVTGTLALDSIGSAKDVCPNRQCPSESARRKVEDDKASSVPSLDDLPRAVEEEAI